MPEAEAIQAFRQFMQENPGMAQMLAALQPTAKELYPNDPEVHDWTYRDLPGRLSEWAWNELTGILGEGNYRVVAMSESWKDDKLEWRRGQLLISPAGMDRLRQESAARRAAAMTSTT